MHVHSKIVPDYKVMIFLESPKKIRCRCSLTSTHNICGERNKYSEIPLLRPPKIKTSSIKNLICKV